MTASYDGSVRSLDVQQGVFEAIVLDEQSEWSAMDCRSDGSCVYLGDKDGDCCAVDLRSHKRVVPLFSCHNKKFNTLHVRAHPCCLHCISLLSTILLSLQYAWIALPNCVLLLHHPLWQTACLGPRIGWCMSYRSFLSSRVHV